MLSRSQQVTKACKKHGGFYLGSIGGPAAILASNCITKMEVFLLLFLALSWLVLFWFVWFGIVVVVVVVDGIVCVCYCRL